MKPKFYIALFAVITTFSCLGMENIRQEKIIREITVVEEPSIARYLTKDRAVIAGKNGCSIVNPITNEEVIKMSDKRAHVSLRSDKKKVALFRNKTVKIYDTNTGDQEWVTRGSNNIGSATFSPLENTIFLVCHKYNNDVRYHKSVIIKHNYVTNECTEIYKGTFLYENIALHPTQNIMCAGNEQREIFLYQLNDLKSPSKKEKLKGPLPQYYQYSHDGSFIMASGVFDTYIIDSNLSHLQPYFKSENMVHKTILNQNSTIFARLVRSQQEKIEFYVIEYWDIATQKCIYKAKVEKKELWAPFDRDLSFSFDETELMIVAENKCLIVPVHFNVNKKKAVFCLWILKNYQSNNPEIPSDIVEYIVNTLHDIDQKDLF